LFNSLQCSGSYSATSNNYEVGTLAVDGWAVTLVQLGGTGRSSSPSSPLLTVPNVIVHPSTASIAV